MKKAIITGCFGQDGRLLFELLDKKGYQIIGIGRNNLRSNFPHSTTHIDIKNYSQITQLINEFKPNEIYHLSAFHHSSASCFGIYAAIRKKEFIKIVLFVSVVAYFVIASSGHTFHAAVHGRIRLPIIPYLIILSCYGMTELTHRFKKYPTGQADIQTLNSTSYLYSKRTDGIL